MHAVQETEDETNSKSANISDGDVVIDYDLLYDTVKQHKEILNASLQLLDNVQHQHLDPTLTQYQIDAVRWAVNQEQHSAIKGGILADEMGLGKTVEMLAIILNHPRQQLPEIPWLEPVCTATEATPSTELQTEKRRKIEVETGSATDKNELILCVCGSRNTNKTLVQCLKCQRQQHSACVSYDLTDGYRGEYYCPQCRTTLDPIESKATLIVTPQSIAHQWAEEIHRHVDRDDFKVLVYRGINNQGYLQPLQIAKYDVVITSYESLRKELYFADVKINGSEKRLRRRAAYMAPPSPLTSCQFWRLCLDEAQMVEGSATRAAEMVRKFHSIHRWCVTGTPIQKSVFDLFGLLLFLGVDRYSERRHFVDDLETPFKRGRVQPLVQCLAPIFWRTRKSQVMDQIEIPPQEEQVHWLTFTPVEEHFYQQQHFLCRNDALARFVKFKGNLTDKISSVDRKTVNSLLLPLLRLRQVHCFYIARLCSHPTELSIPLTGLRSSANGARSVRSSAPLDVDHGRVAGNADQTGASGVRREPAAARGRLQRTGCP